MKKRAVIGISTGLLVDSGGIFPGYHRIYVNRDYVDSVLASGGVPLMLPMSDDQEALEKALSLIDGLILSGGHDVSPINYGEEPHQKLGEICPERDRYDYFLYRKAKERGIPILGICRGIQVINTCEGGTLYQDLSEKSGDVYKHMQGHSPKTATHSVGIAKDSRLQKILGKEELRVNSFHHQILKDIAADFDVSARAKDGVVEAIEHRSADFIIGVQWHPEMRSMVDPDMKKLFQALITEAGR